MDGVEALAGIDLTYLSERSQSSMLVDVAPLGFSYYVYLKQAAEEPVAQIEQEVRSFLEAEPFRKKYPQAYAKWHDAEQQLWTSESERELTTIGHLGREALQAFADALVQKLKIDPEADKARTIARLKDVLVQMETRVGKTRKRFFIETAQ